MSRPVAPPRRYDYVSDGPAIYVDSFATIRREADLSGVPADAEKLAVRMVITFLASLDFTVWIALPA